MTLTKTTLTKTTLTKMSKTAFFLVLVLTVSAGLAQARPVSSGTTTVTLSSDFLGALGSLGITAGTILPTSLVGANVNFPVVSGALDLKSAKGEIIHSGGLTLTKGSTSLRIQSFTIDTTGPAPVLTGLAVVNNSLVGRIVLFDITLPPGFKVPVKLTNNVLLDLSQVGVTLNASAAATLNSVFGTSAFVGGFNIGTARVTALFQP